MHFLEPTNDYAFKRIFGDERKKDVLINFLNNILGKKGEETITEVSLLDPNQAPLAKGSKQTLLDVFCRDQSGNRYIVEMQVLSKKHFDPRVLYYASRAYGSQLDSGDEYHDLNPVIFVGILGFEFTTSSNYISNHLILDVETNEHVLKDFEFVFIELPKFKKCEHEISSVVDQWIYFLKNAKDCESVPEEIHEQAVREAFAIVNRGAWSSAELFQYDRIAIARGDAEMEIAKGREQGRVEGIRETVLKFLRSGVSAEIVQQATGLSLEEIEAISQAT